VRVLWYIKRKKATLLRLKERNCQTDLF